MAGSGGGKGRGKMPIIAAGVAAAVLLGGAGAYFMTGSSTTEAQVQLEAVSTPGPSPFTAPVGNDLTGVVAPANAQGQQAGNTGGLYGQNPQQNACDNSALINQLSADPQKASAWGQPLGVPAQSISPFVNSLSPVTLRADTAVTEYGYSSGQFLPYPAMLEAGTAVLVNGFGEPTVKCFSGNPLGRSTPSNTSSRVVGVSWNGYSPKRTITVLPAPAPQARLIVVNNITNVQAPATMRPPVLTTPLPAPPTAKNGQLALTGVHNYDGTVSLSDGRIMNPDGSIKDSKVAVKHPAGSQTLSDGSIREPNGLIFNADGTERRPVPGPNGVTINPDGTTSPAKPGTVVKWNYDGTATVFEPGAGNGANVTTVGPNGTSKSTPVSQGGVVLPDGSIKNADGTVTNPDGTQRLQRTLPNGTNLSQVGTNTPQGGTIVDPKMQQAGGLTAATATTGSATGTSSAAASTGAAGTTTGAAGATTTGAAGTTTGAAASTGAAGTTTGAAGATTTGAAGTTTGAAASTGAAGTTTGAAGTTTSGAAGTTTTGAAASTGAAGTTTGAAGATTSGASGATTTGAAGTTTGAAASTGAAGTTTGAAASTGAAGATTTGTNSGRGASCAHPPPCP